ncbi:DNA polymerase III subunit beta [Desulfocurvus sp. DL9XJH121]
MFLKVFRDDIIEGLSKSASIIPAKTGAAFLRTIWLKVEGGALRIMSTDSNLEFCGQYNAEIVDQGLVGVQGRSFYDLIRKLPPGQITLKADADGQYLSIQQGNRRYKLPTNEASWFQDFSAFPEENSVYWSGDFLQDLIDRTLYCISDEDTMEAIACMNLAASPEGHIEACGLNGHQFAMTRFLQDDVKAMLPEGGVLIQKKYLTELKKWLTSDVIELNMDEKRLFFRTEDKSELFSLPLSFYKYPDYNTFLSKIRDDGVSDLSADRLEMIDALERIIIFNTDNNRCTYFQFGGEEVTLYSQGQDVGTASESLEVSFSGGLEKIAFPTRNLIEILNHFQSEKVTFKFTGAEGPCGIAGVDDADYQVIIMPMKIVEETYYSEEDIQ